MDNRIPPLVVIQFCDTIFFLCSLITLHPELIILNVYIINIGFVIQYFVVLTINADVKSIKKASEISKIAV